MAVGTMLMALHEKLFKKFFQGFAPGELCLNVDIWVWCLFLKENYKFWNLGAMTRWTLILTIFKVIDMDNKYNPMR